MNQCSLEKLHNIPKIAITISTLFLLPNTQVRAQDEEPEFMPPATGGIYYEDAKELMVGISFINGQFIPTHQTTPNSNQIDYSDFDINDHADARNALGQFASMNPSDSGYDALLARLNEAIDLGTIGREDIDGAGLPNHDLYLGSLVELDPTGVPTRDQIVDYLIWVANRWEESAWGEPVPNPTVTNLEEFAENLLAGSPYLEEASSPMEALNNFMAFYNGNTEDLLIDLLLDGDHTHTYIGGWANSDAPLVGELLTGAISQSPEKLAAISKALRGPDRDAVVALYSRDHDTNYEVDILSKLDWTGVDTAGLDFYHINLSNSNLSGSQLSSAAYLMGVQANSLNLTGFNPGIKPIDYAEFNYATNVNVNNIIQSSNFSNTTFIGAKKPDGSPVTRADFESAIASQFSGSEAAAKLAQLDSINFE